MFIKTLFLSIITVLTTSVYGASALNIAVSSNFAPVVFQIKAQFEKEYNTKLKVITGSTGKLFAMAINSAPYDIFMGADNIKTQKLIELKLAQNPFVYAFGKLALWDRGLVTNAQKMSCSARVSMLAKDDKLALANTLHAPYGITAKSWLVRNSLWEKVSKQIVFGENISQTFTFVKTKNAQAGIVALSLLKTSKIAPSEYCLLDLKQNIIQELVVMNSSKSKTMTNNFIKFLASQKIQALISKNGYESPKN